MMVSSSFYREKNENKTLKELITEKNNLITSINEYEQNKILPETPVFTDEDYVKTSPRTVYRISLDYLKEILDLINKKKKKKIVNYRSSDMLCIMIL